MKGDIQRQSTLGIKTKRENPRDEVAKNAQLLVRAGYIHKHSAGVYEFLPLGLRSLKKIMQIVREEINAIGAQEVLLSSIQIPDIWKKTKRWEGKAESEIWFKTSLRAGGEIGLGWTHEEPITNMMTQNIHSYKDLPVFLYQFQTKFRNEERAKSGIMRTREFIMKDLYSFCKDEKEHKAFYETAAEAYSTIYKRCGIGKYTFRTFSSGGVFSPFSDEFQTIIPTGEDIIYLNREKGIALNKEVYTDENLKQFNLTKNDMEEVSASEVGNIFTLGTKFSEALGLTYQDASEKTHPVYMGSYGIGVARVLGVIIELFGEKDEMLLPYTVSPYNAHILLLDDSDEVQKRGEQVAQKLSQQGKDVLIDNREVSAGEKFADADLLGIPQRIVISKKSIEKGGVEYTDRIKKETTNTTEENAVSLII